MFSHIRRHGVPLFFDVEKHKMDGEVPQMIFQVRQQVGQSTLCAAGCERVNDKDYVSGRRAH
jgi:hypothetical protein